MIDRTEKPLAQPSDEELMKLISLAGPRPQVAETMAVNARANVREHWLETVRARRRLRQRRWLLAAAAVTTLAVAIGIRVTGERPVAAAIATVERSFGGVEIGDEAGALGVIGPGTTIKTGTDGGLALRLRGGASLRVAENTRLTLSTERRVALDVGRVYVDTGPEEGDSVEILTALGVARDIGTQFQVAYDKQRLSVGVREGAVSIERIGAPSKVAPSGVFVEIGQRSDVVEESVDPTDARWDWAEALAPVFDTDGATLHEFLSFYARESGLTLVFAGDSAASARRHRFDGQLSTTSLTAMLDEAKALFAFETTVDGDTLLVTMP